MSNPKLQIGRAKPGFNSFPLAAEILAGLATDDGSRKYGLFNYRGDQVTASVYYNAMRRHLLAWAAGEECAADSGLPHLAHIIANSAILLDATLRGNLDDDRSVDDVALKLLARLSAGEKISDIMKECTDAE